MGGKHMAGEAPRIEDKGVLSLDGQKVLQVTQSPEDELMHEESEGDQPSKPRHHQLTLLAPINWPSY